jgi:hypothetical protein
MSTGRKVRPLAERIKANQAKAAVLEAIQKVEIAQENKRKAVERARKANGS